MKQPSTQPATTKRVEFQCKSEVYALLQAAQRDLYRGQSGQLNVCLEILFGLRDEQNESTKEFRLWLEHHQAHGHQPVNVPRLMGQRDRERQIERARAS